MGPIINMHIHFHHLDVSQAFDKVSHLGLLYKLKLLLPSHYYPIVKSYFVDRFFSDAYALPSHLQQK